MHTKTITLIIALAISTAWALEPNEILIIANSDSNDSMQIARHYCSRRNVPEKNILAIALGSRLKDTISRADYDKELAGVVRKKLALPELKGKIKCLLTIYGVPFKVEGRGRLPGQEERLAQLQAAAAQLKNSGAEPGNANSGNSQQLQHIESQIGQILGKETGASVDSELSMVLFDGYELYRWQPNELKGNILAAERKTLMVSRLDGPGRQIAKGLIDKAIAAEKNGISGFAYIDSRGIKDDSRQYSFGSFDQSLRDLAVLIQFRTHLTVKEEKTAKLFEPGQCPQTAIYCGWYSVSKYIDSFDFVDGAVGYHIASWEAANLRDPNSTQWCPSMLRHGITATLGPVSEPYLAAFPLPKDFFLQLIEGRCLAEAYYDTLPFNSWQMLLIGDPLYKPFGKN